MSSSFAYLEIFEEVDEVRGQVMFIRGIHLMQVLSFLPFFSPLFFHFIYLADGEPGTDRLFDPKHVRQIH